MANDPRFPPIKQLLERAPWNIGPATVNPQIGDVTYRRGLQPSLTGGGLPTTPDAEFYKPIWVAMPHQYAMPIRVLIVVPNGASTNVPDITEAVGFRNFLMMRNASPTGTNVYVDFGIPASLDSPIRLEPNVMILYDQVVPQSDIFSYAEGPGGKLTISYSAIELPPIPVW